MLINQPTTDIAGGTGAIPLVRGDVTGAVAVSCQSQPNTTIYTVPADTYFEGWIVPESSSTMYIKINGVQCVYKMQTTYSMEPRPIALYAGDVLSNGQSSYWSLIGLLRKAN
jgi:hypothetical protein